MNFIVKIKMNVETEIRFPAFQLKSKHVSNDHIRTSLVTVGIPDPASFTPLGNGIEGGMSEEFSGVSTEPMVGMFFLRATFFG